MSTEALRRWAYISVTALVAALGIWLVFRYMAVVAAPFIVGWVVSLLVRPAAKWMNAKTNMPYRLATVIMLLVVMLFLGYVVSCGASKLVSETAGFLGDVVGDLESDDNIIRKSMTYFEGMREKIPLLGKIIEKNDGISETVYSMLEEALKSLAEKLSVSLTTAVGAIVRGLPGALFTAVATVLACFYLTLDRDKFLVSASVFVPEKVRLTAGKISGGALGAMGGYFRAYLILLLVTFSELLLGLSILRVEYSLLIAALIALIDLLPVFGVGTVMVPWTIICLIGGNRRLGIGLIVVYGIIYLVRQFIEPHLVGNCMGIHPLTSLIAVYAGFKLFGIIGMILAPMAVYAAKIVIESTKGTPSGRSSGDAEAEDSKPKREWGRKSRGKHCE